METLQSVSLFSSILYFIFTMNCVIFNIIRSQRDIFKLYFAIVMSILGILAIIGGSWSHVLWIFYLVTGVISTTLNFWNIFERRDIILLLQLFGSVQTLFMMLEEGGGLNAVLNFMVVLLKFLLLLQASRIIFELLNLQKETLFFIWIQSIVCNMFWDHIIKSNVWLFTGYFIGFILLLIVSACQIQNQPEKQTANSSKMKKHKNSSTSVQQQQQSTSIPTKNQSTSSVSLQETSKPPISEQRKIASSNPVSGRSSFQVKNGVEKEEKNAEENTFDVEKVQKLKKEQQGSADEFEELNINQPIS